MKKILLFLPILFLVGCSGAKNVSFKKLKYDKPLTDKELEEFDENFTKACKDIKSIKLSGITEEKHGFIDTKTSSEATYTVFTNGSKLETNVKIDSEDNGVSYSTKETSEENTWVLENRGIRRAVTVSTSSESKEAEFEVNEYLDEEISVPYFALFLGLPQADLVDVVAYHNGKDYAIVFSKQTKQVQDETILGQKKDLINTQDRQLVIEVDKNYKIKSGTYVSQSGVNRDPDTKEWYKRVKTISSFQTSMKVSYGSVSARNESELLDILKKEDKTLTFGANPLFKMGYYDGTSAKPTEASFTAAPEFHDVVINYDENNGTEYVQFIGQFNLRENGNAFLSNLYAEAIYLTKEGFKGVTTQNFGHISDYTFVFSEEMTTGSTSVPFMYKTNANGATFELRFTLNLGENVTYSINPRVSQVQL